MAISRGEAQAKAPPSYGVFLIIPQRLDEGRLAKIASADCQNRYDRGVLGVRESLRSPTSQQCSAKPIRPEIAAPPFCLPSLALSFQDCTSFIWGSAVGASPICCSFGAEFPELPVYLKEFGFWCRGKGRLIPRLTVRPRCLPRILHPALTRLRWGAIADALRQLDTLRQEGLISEYEFEQKRRRLLDQIG